MLCVTLSRTTLSSCGLSGGTDPGKTDAGPSSQPTAEPSSRTPDVLKFPRRHKRCVHCHRGCCVVISLLHAGHHGVRHAGGLALLHQQTLVQRHRIRCPVLR